VIRRVGRDQADTNDISENEIRWIAFRDICKRGICQRFGRGREWVDAVLSRELRSQRNLIGKEEAINIPPSSLGIWWPDPAAKAGRQRPSLFYLYTLHFEILPNCH
jgi:hypothetical protein